MRFRVGVDVGGTFTDFLISSAGQTARVYKSSTTPKNPAIGFFNGLEQAARDQDMELDEFLSHVDSIVHGTTITTNAVLTGNGAKAGFITTKGFRDVLNMRRGMKERQFERYGPVILKGRLRMRDQTFDGFLTNLSEGGTFFHAESLPSSSSLAELEFELPWELGSCRLTCSVAWLRSEGPDAKRGAGLSFREFEGESREKISSYLVRFREFAADLDFQA